MIVTFEKKYLQELYEMGASTDKKCRFQPVIVRKYIDCVNILLSTKSLEALYTVNALHYKVLKGEKKGISSIRVNKQYRIEFTVTQVFSEEIVTICNILDLSNHYK